MIIALITHIHRSQKVHKNEAVNRTETIYKKDTINFITLQPISQFKPQKKFDYAFLS